MRLITLNIWGGKLSEPLLTFLKVHAEATDIFCLQEVFNNPPSLPSRIQQNARLSIYFDIRAALPDFEAYINPMQENEESLAMFVRKTIPLKKVDEIFVYRWKNALENDDPSTYGINVQYIQFQYNKKKFTVSNFHGHWTPNFKGDTPARIEQAKNIKHFLKKTGGAKILCGDFNMSPNTESLKIVEKDMRNLVSEYGVTSTRSQYYTKPEKYADYILVSKEVQVNAFAVLQTPVSDHLPLFIEFD